MVTQTRMTRDAAMGRPPRPIIVGLAAPDERQVVRWSNTCGPRALVLCGPGAEPRGIMPPRPASCMTGIPLQSSGRTSRVHNGPSRRRCLNEEDSVRVLRLSTIGLALVLWQVPSGAQWTNRYPKVTGFNHHVYLEGYDLPVVGTGPTDPAPSPDGRAVAFAARGWLWLQDLATGEARRLTRGAALDARPAWAPDGRTIVFVRDNTKDTSLVSLDLASGRETVIVDTPAMDLDPVYARDGKAIFYASAEAGDFDLYRRDLASGAVTRLTSDKGLELRPQPLPDGAQVVFLSKQSGTDTVAVLDLRDRFTPRARRGADRLADAPGPRSDGPRRGNRPARSRRMGDLAPRHRRRSPGSTRGRPRHADHARVERRRIGGVFRRRRSRADVPAVARATRRRNARADRHDGLAVGRAHRPRPHPDHAGGHTQAGQAPPGRPRWPSRIARRRPGVVRRPERAALLLLSGIDRRRGSRRPGARGRDRRVRLTRGHGHGRGHARPDRHGGPLLLAARDAAARWLVLR